MFSDEIQDAESMSLCVAAWTSLMTWVADDCPVVVSLKYGMVPGSGGAVCKVLQLWFDVRHESVPL